MPRDLQPLFAPQSVAILGASNDPAKWGNWLARGALVGDAESVRYPPRPTKLDPYDALIRERLDTYPELTAVRLFDEVRAEGLTVVAAVKTR